MSVCFAAAISSCGCGGEKRVDSAFPRPAPLFTDVTVAAGIDAHHSLPPDGITNIVDSNGGGAAFVDVDGDGWLDLLVAGGARSPDPGADPARHGGLRAYRNLHDGRFEDATESWGLPRDGTGVAWAVADFDGDGDRDLYLVDYGPNHLYENLGGGELRDITDRAGVGDARFGIGAVFFDMDGDGDLDLYCANYLEFDESPPSQYRSGPIPVPLPGPLRRMCCTGIAATGPSKMSPARRESPQSRDEA